MVLQKARLPYLAVHQYKSGNFRAYIIHIQDPERLREPLRASLPQLLGQWGSPGLTTSRPVA